MKREILFRIASTNFYTCLRILATACGLGFFYLLVEKGFSISNLFGALFLPLLYLLSFGLIFWVGFLLATFFLDLLLFSIGFKTLVALSIEAALIGGLLLFWGTWYDFPLWFGLVAIYIPAQMLRAKDIAKIINSSVAK